MNRLATRQRIASPSQILGINTVRYENDYKARA